MIDLTGKRVLHLTLSKAPFEVMVTGEKKQEFRKPSKWIESRLLDKQKSFQPKEYDLVKFTNGYGKSCPWFIAEYKMFNRHSHFYKELKKVYSNGLEVLVQSDDYIIHLGEILEIGNYELKK
jgi:hypothetical protein